MADVLIKSETMANIADAIREKLGVSNTYFPSEMPDAIKSIEGGGGEIKYVLNFINGGYINTDDGSVVSYSSWKYSDYVPIIAPKLIVTSNETATNYNAFYDKDKQYISGFLLNEVVDIPSNAAYFRISVGKEFDAIATGIDKQHETPEITDITFAEDYSALATTVDGDIREITPTMVDGVITEIDVDGSKIAVEYDDDGYLAKVGSVDVDGVGELPISICINVADKLISDTNNHTLTYTFENDYDHINITATLRCYARSASSNVSYTGDGTIEHRYANIFSNDYYTNVAAIFYSVTLLNVKKGDTIAFYNTHSLNIEPYDKYWSCILFA